MSVTRIRTLVLVALALCLVGLVATGWRASGAPTRTPVRPQATASEPARSREDVGVVTKVFASPGDARAYLADVADKLGRNDPGLVSAFCPLQVPGSLEYVVRRGARMTETVVLMARGNRVRRISLRHRRDLPEREVQASITRAARGWTTG